MERDDEAESGEAYNAHGEEEKTWDPDVYLSSELLDAVYEEALDGAESGNARDCIWGEEKLEERE